MVCPKVQVGGRDGPHTPLRLRRERLRLVVGGGGHDDLVAVDVGGSRGGSRQLRLFLGLLLNLGDLLTLLGGCRDLHSQDDVANFRLRQRSYVNAGRKNVKQNAAIRKYRSAMRTRVAYHVTRVRLPCTNK